MVEPEPILIIDPSDCEPFSINRYSWKVLPRQNLGLFYSIFETDLCSVHICPKDFQFHPIHSTVIPSYLSLTSVHASSPKGEWTFALLTL